jgi:hypothetical protein
LEVVLVDDLPAVLALAVSAVIGGEETEGAGTEGVVEIAVVATGVVAAAEPVLC